MSGWKARISRRDAAQIVAETLEQILGTIDDVANDVWVDESIVESIRQRAIELQSSLP